jgi:hypothetical protein
MEDEAALKEMELPAVAAASNVTIDPVAEPESPEMVPIPPPLVVVARVPEVGNVTLVAPVILNVVGKAPTTAKDPPNVNVLVLSFSTPVPPFWGGIGSAPM